MTPDILIPKDNKTRTGIILPPGVKLRKNSEKLDDFLYVLEHTRQMRPILCPNCGGSRVLPKQKGFRRYKLPCPMCHASGRV